MSNNYIINKFKYSPKYFLCSRMNNWDLFDINKIIIKKHEMSYLKSGQC